MTNCFLGDCCVDLWKLLHSWIIVEYWIIRFICVIGFHRWIKGLQFILFIRHTFRRSCLGTQPLSNCVLTERNDRFIIEILPRFRHFGVYIKTCCVCANVLDLIYSKSALEKIRNTTYGKFIDNITRTW